MIEELKEYWLEWVKIVKNEENKEKYLTFAHFMDWLITIKTYPKVNYDELMNKHE